MKWFRRRPKFVKDFDRYELRKQTNSMTKEVRWYIAIEWLRLFDDGSVKPNIDAWTGEPHWENYRTSESGTIYFDTREAAEDQIMRMMELQSWEDDRGDFKKYGIEEKGVHNG